MYSPYKRDVSGKKRCFSEASFFVHSLCSDKVQEISVDARVAVEFRVERECDLIPVFHGDNLLGVCAIGISVCTCRPRKNLHIVADGFEEWGADKCLRDLPDMRDLIFGEKTAELSAVSVATDNGGERREVGVSFACDFFGKQDGACTCRKYGQSSLNFSPERFKKPEVARSMNAPCTASTPICGLSIFIISPFRP